MKGHRYKPLVFRGEQKELYRLAAEYRDYCGYAVKLLPTKLIVYPRLANVKKEARG